MDLNYVSEYGRNIFQIAAERNDVSSFNSIAQKFRAKYQFSKEGIDDIALISMIRNEEDIIFENLVWHFAIGFRKFVISNHLSADRTLEIVGNFSALTKGYAKVFIIDVPMEEYIQARVTNGAFKFVQNIWPEVKWVFPVDADEFWVAKYPLKQMLMIIPDDVCAINVLSSIYVPSQDYYDFPDEAKFYQKIHYRDNRVHYGKVAAKALGDIIISQGAHNVDRTGSEEIRYVFAPQIGISMYTFPSRSIEQIHNKYFYGRASNMRAKELGLIDQSFGSYWDRYGEYVEKYGDKAGEVRFNESLGDLTFALDDPLPFDEALNIFYEVIGWESCLT